jgi:hypothetical protein
MVAAMELSLRTTSSEEEEEKEEGCRVGSMPW